MKIIVKRALKTFLIMTIAYLISDFSIKEVFIAQSPRLNPYFITNTIVRVNNYWIKTGNFVASINFIPKLNLQNIFDSQNAYNLTNNNNQFNNQPSSFNLTKAQVNRILEAPLKKVSVGVYAGEQDGYKVYQINTNELGYITYTFNIDGKEVKVKVPSNKQAPSQQEIEDIYGR